MRTVPSTAPVLAPRIAKGRTIWITPPAWATVEELDSGPAAKPSGNSLTKGAGAPAPAIIRVIAISDIGVWAISAVIAVRLVLIGRCTRIRPGVAVDVETV